MEEIDDDYSEDFEEEDTPLSGGDFGRSFSGDARVTPRLCRGDSPSPRSRRFVSEGGQTAISPAKVTSKNTSTPRTSNTFRQSLSWKTKGGRLTNPKLQRPKDSISVMSPYNREMSAYRHSISKLQNKVSEIQKELEESKKENKLLNRLRVRQEKALTHYQAQEGDLPQLLARHAEEVRVLREHLKKSMSNSHQYQKQLSEYRQEVIRLGDQKKKLQEVATKKDLLGRDKLTRQLKLATGLLKEKENKVAELERALELIKKNHACEVRALNQNNRTLSAQMDTLRQTVRKTSLRLKAREKNLNVMNMYTQRFNKVTQWESSVPATPITQSAQTEVTCPADKDMLFKPTSETDMGSSKRGKMKAVQTDIRLDHKDTDLELKTVSIRASKKPDMASKEVQTSASIEGVSSKDKLVMPTSKVQPGLVPSGSVQSVTDKPVKPSASNEGKSGFGSLEEGERRKREELLAKLRAIDGGKNPPESQPIQSTVTKGSGAVQASGSQDTLKGSQDTRATGVRTSPSKVSQDSRFSLPTLGKGNGHTTFITQSPPHLLAMGTDTAREGEKQISRQGADMTTTAGTAPVTNTQPTSHDSASHPLQSTNKQATSTNLRPAITKRSSLANLSGGLMTSGVSNLSSLLEDSRKGTVPAHRAEGEGLVDTKRDKQNQVARLLGSNMESSAVGGGARGAGGEGEGEEEEEEEEDQKTPASGNSSCSSMQSWPDKIQNLHTGKPAYSTDTDPFGRKHVAALNRQSSGNARTDSTGSGYKPLHGRRAGGGGATKPNGRTTDSFQSLTNKHSGSNLLSRRNMQPRAESESYPWEVPIDVQGKEQVEQLPGKARQTIRTKEQVMQAKTIAGMGNVIGAGPALLPLRPKRESSDYELSLGGDNNINHSTRGSVGTHNAVAEPDDLEEMTL